MKCNECLKKLKQIQIGGFLDVFSLQYCFYCEDDKCKRFGLLTVGGKKDVSIKSSKTRKGKK